MLWPTLRSALGQVFTPAEVVRRMLALRRNRGSVLEPSCGDGAFLRRLGGGAVGLEIDPEMAARARAAVGAGRGPRPRVLCRDFFSYPTGHKFDTVIGNPPYVRHQDIAEGTRSLLPRGDFDGRSNLFLFFIRKSMEHLNPGGELIFITPREFISLTSARRLNELLHRAGTITHFYDLGDARIFDDATPNCAIWRWVKGETSRRRIQDGRFFHCRNGLISFPDSPVAGIVGDSFQVRVGAVSGADRVFENESRGCTSFVCSRTARRGETRRMIYNRMDRALEPHKERLLNRRIRRFDESNWWEWGRQYRETDAPRVYVNCKTRNPRPFFRHEATAWDGSMLALFPRSGVDLDRAEAALNDVDWRALGFVCDGRFLFTQRSLENAPLEALQ